MVIAISTIRISDRGGGIPHHLTKRALEYNFTTANDGATNSPPALSGASSQEGVFSDMMEAVNPNPAGGPMHGWVSTDIGYPYLQG